MKVVTGEIMQRMDRRAIDEFGIAGLDLMERAGRGCADVIFARFGTGSGKKAIIVAGKGNNGGDGYVIARLLQEEGWDVAVFVIARREEIVGDASVNLDRLSGAAVTFSPGGLRTHQSQFAEATVIVDALFGTGLKSALRGEFLEAVELMNGAGRPLVAVDIPSGIDAGTGKILGGAVRADLTVTFALAKLGHVLYPGGDLCGKLYVVDIGIPSEVASASPGVEFVDRRSARLLLRRRERTAHKGNFGHALIVAGSTGKSGAAAMAANSAVRAGAGLVTLAVPDKIHAILEVKTTEAMTLSVPDHGTGAFGEDACPVIAAACEGKDALAVGPGMGWGQVTALLVRKLVREMDMPLVVDADGLNALSEDTSVLLHKKSGTVVLTPHPGEMARLCGTTVAAIEADRIGAAREFAIGNGVFVVLKGARTVMASPDGSVAINGSGNPGMASGGMGDVLTGVLVSLLAQGYPAFIACQLGVFLHGHAADLVAAGKGEIGISAVDVQEQLPYACKDLLDRDDDDYV